MQKRILSILVSVALLAGGLVGVDLSAQAATVTGGTVTAVTDKAQVAALGTSLSLGKTINSYDFWDGTRQPENGQVMKPANIQSPQYGPLESAFAANHGVLTDGDFYLKDELTFATAPGSEGDAYYNPHLDACLVANPWQVANNKTPLKAKTTAYQRFAWYWADTDSYRMYFDLGKESTVTDLLVASGVNLNYVDVDTLVDKTAAEIAALATSYQEISLLKNVQVYISSDLDKLYDDASQVFTYVGTLEESWANILHLDKAAKGRYVGYKLGHSSKMSRVLAELGVYDTTPAEEEEETEVTFTVEAVTSRSQVAALGDSYLSGKEWYSYAYWNGTSATHQLRYANRVPENQWKCVWENGNSHTIATDGDYYLPGELVFARQDGELIGNAHQLANNLSPVYAQSTAYERFIYYWPASDSYQMFYDLGQDTLVSDVFVASGVTIAHASLAGLQNKTAAEIAAAEKTYDKDSFLRYLKVFVSDDLDTLYDAGNAVVVYEAGADFEQTAWANIFHLAQARRGRYVGFQFGDSVSSPYRSIAEVGVYGSNPPAAFLGAQLRDENTQQRTADLRFGFTMSCVGVGRNDTTFQRVLTADSAVKIGTKTYPLVDMGAVVARGDIHPTEELTLELAATSDYASKVSAQKLYEATADSITFTAVITGIPARYYGTALRARPYVAYQDGDAVRYLFGDDVMRRVNHLCEGSEELAVDTTKESILSHLAAMEAAVDAAAEQPGKYAELTDYAYLVTDGIWTQALQTALNENEYLHIPGSTEKYMIDTTVTIPSNRHILADEDAVICLTADCEVLMLRNRHNVDGTLYKTDQSNRDENIFIQGGIWMEARGKRAGYGKSGRYDNNRVKGNYYGISTCMLFNNVENLRLKDMTFVETSGFAVQVGELSNGVFENITFDNCFADGLHINGSTENVVVRHISGTTYDDLVALNMYDWQDSSVTFGPTRNVLVEDVVSPEVNASRAMRILPGIYTFRDGSAVDCVAENIIVRNIKGIQYFKMYLQTPQYTIGSTPEKGAVGSGKNIFFENIDINLSSANHWYGSNMSADTLRNPFGAFEINSNIQNVHFSNIRLICDFTKYPMANLLHVGPLSARKDNVEVLDPYFSSVLSKVTWDTILVNGKPMEDLSSYVYTSNFNNINGDGMSTGKGEITAIQKLYE